MSGYRNDIVGDGRGDDSLGHYRVVGRVIRLQFQLT